MKTTVLMHDLFENSYNDLDGSVKGRVLSFMVKLQQDPNGTGLDFKHPKGAASKHVRTARVNDHYRAVLVNAGADDDNSTLWLVAVKKHDAAYKFAETLTLQVNQKTGAAELFDPIALGEALDHARAEPPASAGSEPVMPSTVSQADLERFGVAPEVAVELKQVSTEDALQKVIEALPASQGNAVLDLAFGKDPQDVWNDLVIDEPGPIDPNDIETALKRPLSRLSFTAVDGDNEEELRAVLEGDFAKWRVWLHPLQRKLATHSGWNGPFRVTGGAGTGKTVTAIHRARFLARQLDSSGADPKMKVLFTTFTRNLAQTIESQLIQLAGPSITDRVHVVNLDALARTVVAATDNGRKFVNSSKVTPEYQLEQLWRTAAQSSKGNWDPGFLNDEWSEVILGNGIVDEAEYLRVARSGRSQRLTRPQRGDVWLAIQQFQLLMRAQGLTTFKELASRAATSLEADSSLRDQFGYRHAVIDEAQDLHPAHWKLLRALVPAGTDDLFIVGDAHQRIYGKPAPLSRFGIETRGRARRLTVNYRTSREILRWSLQMADADADDLDTSSDTLAGARSVFTGPEPESLGFMSKPEEDKGLVAKIEQWVADGYAKSDIAVFVYERNEVREISESLEAAGVGAEVVNESTKEEKLGDVVRVMTMHRAKGLEYRAVAIASLGSKSFPPYYVQQKQGDEREQEKKKLLRVLYVAGTRARERLALFWTGELSPLLNRE
ncbi:UvrD-helicase domain-containing protein [Mycolicibacterium setense]|uniref:UvrD-helicase domain-containing protein n=1 Tax=Mycolicibacterium setense TaxID=431269 RepID=UPI000574DAB4|nr:UvrD-helicase domain-containing protein [Mycolicibacterium setense]KHO22982.1 helicase UvrD [Mycolicibacterium setense]MCV7115533.1 AAA family ATPase [Mycolicibacterium setense]